VTYYRKQPKVQCSELAYVRRTGPNTAVLIMIPVATFHRIHFKLDLQLGKP